MAEQYDDPTPDHPLGKFRQRLVEEMSESDWPDLEAIVDCINEHYVFDPEGHAAKPETAYANGHRDGRATGLVQAGFIAAGLCAAAALAVVLWIR